MTKILKDLIPDNSLCPWKFSVVPFVCVCVCERQSNVVVKNTKSGLLIQDG